MKVENPVALRFILADELYLLNADKILYDTVAAAELPGVITEPAATVPEPMTAIPQPVAATPVITTATPGVTTPVVAFKYLGKNLKRFLIVVHYPEFEFINDAHLSALENILKRKELSLNDVIILNRANYMDKSYDELIGFFKAKKLLILGNDAMPPGITELKLNVQQPINNLVALYSFGFNEMMDNTEYKKAFWEQMKAL